MKRIISSIAGLASFVAFAGAIIVSSADCGFTATPCKNPNDSWWDCKLVWTSKQTGNDQTAKAWICAPDSNKTGGSTASQAAAQKAIDLAVQEGLACAMPESAINPHFKCIDSHQHLLPTKTLQGEIDVPTELEKKPMKWGDQLCDKCLNDFCKPSLFNCIQNQYCSCLNNCLRLNNPIDACDSSCVGFQQSSLDFEFFSAMAQCATEKCNSTCSNSSMGGPNDDENLACCAKINCKGE